MSSRRQGRIIAFQSVFSKEFSTGDNEYLLEMAWLDSEHRKKYDEGTLAFSRLLTKGTLENISEIDKIIRSALEKWDFSRISKVELAILRISAYSLLYQPSIPSTVTINEAVDIAKEFGGDDSYKFINGVLDGIRKKEMYK